MPRFSRGQRVNVHHSGSEKNRPGEISNVHDRGGFIFQEFVYTVLYDDGEVDYEVYESQMLQKSDGKWVPYTK